MNKDNEQQELRRDAERWRTFLKSASAGVNEDGDLSIGASLIAAEDLWESNGLGERPNKDLPVWIRNLAKKGYSWDDDKIERLVDYALGIDTGTAPSVAALNPDPAGGA
jgi:hypothetical protein